MALDANLVISISLVGVTIIIGLVVIVNILTGRSKVGEKNHKAID
jgi:hypothetical protein